MEEVRYFYETALGVFSRNDRLMVLQGTRSFGFGCLLLSPSHVNQLNQRRAQISLYVKEFRRIRVTLSVGTQKTGSEASIKSYIQRRS